MKTTQCIHTVLDDLTQEIRRCRNVAYGDKDECWRHEGKAQEFMDAQEPIAQMAPTHALSSVNHPPHYNHGKIEAIAVIEDWNLNFNMGNALKYLGRADHKGKPIEDLKKAIWYLQRELARRGA